MRPLQISTVLHGSAELDPTPPEGSLSGGHLFLRQAIAGLLEDERVEHFEIFLPPEGLLHPAVLKRIAEAILPPHRQGKGILSFHPIHAIPEIWQDGKPRMLWCPDVARFSCFRYLRDRFASAPMPILSDTHGVSIHDLFAQLKTLDGHPVWPGDTILAISKPTADMLRTAFHEYLNMEPAAEIELVPHGVRSPQAFESKTACREQLGWPSEGLIVLIRGRVTPAGKSDLIPVLDVFAEAIKHQPATLVIAGPEWYPGYVEYLKSHAEKLEIADHLVFPGAAHGDAVHMGYAAADLLWFPTDAHQEAQGMVAIEAMSHRLPVLASDWDGTKDTVLDGVTGYRVPTWLLPGVERLAKFGWMNTISNEFLGVSQNVIWDRRVMTDRLIELLRNSQLRKTMGEAGYRLYEEKFQFKDRTAKIINLALKGIESQMATTRPAWTGNGLPMPYLQLYDSYRTAGHDISELTLTISSTGLSVLAGKAQVEFYDDMLPLVQPKAVGSLLRTLKDTPQIATEVIQKCAKADGLPEDVVWLTCAFLAKRGAIQLESR